MNERELPSSPCRVLVMLPNWLGDAIMASGLLQLLHDHRRLPSGRTLHLTVAVRQAWAPLFQNDPRVDSLLSIERPGAHAGLGGLWRLGRAMGRGKHVAAVLGPPSLRAALLALLGNIPLRVGYASDGRGALLKVALPVRPRGESHHARELTDLGRALLQRLGRPVDDADLPRDPGLPGVASVEAFPAGAGAFRLVLAPGATYGLAKNWPRERVAELAGLALAEGAEVVAMGDAQARHFVSELAGLLGVAPRDQVDGQGGLVNMAGRTDLLEAVALLKSSSAFVGNDSGLMHLSAALGVPTVGVFGSSNPDWTAPLGSRTATVAAQGFPCRPCYRKTCNQDTFCLDTISGRQVWDRLQALLASGAGGHPAEDQT